MSRMLNGAVALVTGASRGLGALIAVELARHGAHVIICARTIGALEEVDDLVQKVGGIATILPLDLAQFDQTDMVGLSIFERFGRLDVLVHSAVVLGPLTPVSHIQSSDWAAVMSVNLTSTHRLIRTCDPLLRVAPAGRVVFVTDARARDPKAFWAAYGASKAGMEHLVLTWADEVRGTNLRVNLFDPGGMRTRLRRQAFPAENPSLLPPPDWAARVGALLCLPTERRHGQLVQFQDGNASLDA